MTHLPLWFKSLVYTEIFLQLPFFFIAVYAYLKRRNWIRIPAIAYGSFVSATMVPILTELANHKAPFYNPAVVVAFYAPYLIMPLLMAVTMAVTPHPFPQQPGRHKNKEA
ncbi:hypothetical protein N2152v2_001098 [Parachlorella kessleri]